MLRWVPSQPRWSQPEVDSQPRLRDRPHRCAHRGRQRRTSPASAFLCLWAAMAGCSRSVHQGSAQVWDTPAWQDYAPWLLVQHVSALVSALPHDRISSVQPHGEQSELLSCVQAASAPAAPTTASVREAQRAGLSTGAPGGQEAAMQLQPAQDQPSATESTARPTKRRYPRHWPPLPWHATLFSCLLASRACMRQHAGPCSCRGILRACCGQPLMLAAGKPALHQPTPCACRIGTAAAAERPRKRAGGPKAASTASRDAHSALSVSNHVAPAPRRGLRGPAAVQELPLLPSDRAEASAAGAGTAETACRRCAWRIGVLTDPHLSRC